MSSAVDNEATKNALDRAAQHLQRGERPEAAGFYRLAARLLSEEGEDERAVEYARLAADLDDDEAAPEEPKGTVEEPKSPPVRAATRPNKPDAPAKPKGQRRNTGTHSRTGSTGRHRAVREAEVSAPSEITVPAVAPAPLVPPSASAQSASPIPARIDDTVRTKPLEPVPTVIVESTIASAVLATPQNIPSAQLEFLTAVPEQAPSIVSPPVVVAPPVVREPPAPPRPSQPPPVPLPRASQPPPVPPARPRSSPPEPPRAESRPQTSPPPPPPPRPSTPPADPVVTVLASNFTTSPASSWSVPPPPPAARRIDYVRAFLPSLHCFDELGTDRVRELARQVQVLEFDDGDSLFAAGDSNGPLLIITSGSAHVDRPGASPFDLVLSQGEMLGVLSVLHADRRLASARARGPLEAFALAPSLVRSLAREFVTLRRFLHNIAAPRIDSLLPHLSPPLRALSAAAQRHILETCDCYTVEDGTLLQLEGVPVRALHFIAAGSVEVYGEGVRMGTVRHLGAGALIGADAVRDDAPARITARAAGPVLVARIDRAAFRSLIAEYPSARDALRDGPGV